jgi:hypothetical protein
MKRLGSCVLSAFLSVATGTFGQEGVTTFPDPLPEKDLRVINGRLVDLAPLHRWLRNPQGERPLPHWQRFQVMEIKRKMAGLQHCLARQENGDSVEVLIANLPARVSDFFERCRQLDEQIRTAQLDLERKQRRLEEIDATVPVKTGAPAWYEDDWTRRRYQVDLELVRVKHAREDLQKLQDTRDRMAAEAAKNTTILAMRTAREYAGLRVWDCGVPKAQPRW